MQHLTLIHPAPEHESLVMEYRTEMLNAGDTLDGCAGLEDTENYNEWLDFKGRLSKKYGDGYVPSLVYLAIRNSDNKLVGIMDYRTPLSDFLLNFGGSIGYSVRPSERGHGYAKEMLNLLCGICRENGADRVLLTCDKQNEASRRTIIANGGILENEVADTVGLEKSGIIQRYWITL